MGKEPKVYARTVLWYLVFVGFAVNYMIRINMNITIVTMVKQAGRKSSAASSEEITNGTSVDRVQRKVYACYVERNGSDFAEDLAKSSAMTLLQSEPKVQSPEKWLLKLLKLDTKEDGFEWNEYEQGLVLGAFFWLHWVTQIPGGVLARKYGTKMVFGVANAIGCWMCFLMPLASYWDIRILIFLRVVQGVICVGFGELLG
uniref:Sialin n=1 Tax=Culex pipiens TaxID=7175 RepID=A0A8D8MGG1_CULPI